MNQRSARGMKAFLRSATLALFAVSAGFAQQTKPLDPANMDLSVKPNVDFYQYANGGWLKNNPIPADQTIWASFQILREKNLAAELSICYPLARFQHLPLVTVIYDTTIVLTFVMCSLWLVNLFVFLCDC